MSVTTNANQILSNRPSTKSGRLPERFWEIVHEYRGELINQALAIVGDLNDAEDVVQETFWEAFKNHEKMTGARSLRAHLRVINRANALDLTRKVKRGGAIGGKSRSIESSEERGITGGFGRMDTRETIAKAIEELPERLRQVAILRFWEHLKRDEIVQRLGLPPGTVRRQLYEATSALHEKLSKYLGDSGRTSTG